MIYLTEKKTHFFPGHIGGMKNNMHYFINQVYYITSFQQSR